MINCKIGKLIILIKVSQADFLIWFFNKKNNLKSRLCIDALQSLITLVVKKIENTIFTSGIKLEIDC
jgi:hypothetical protein